VQEDTVAGWLGRLASAAPAPGGGAAAALAAAAGAALVEMVVNLTVGRAAYAAHADEVAAIGVEAGGLRQRALDLMTADADAFEAVMAAYRLPKQTADEQRRRRAAIQDATARAAEPPLRVAEVAGRVVELAAALPGRSNPNVLSDVGVAAALARAALASAAINVEVNLAGLTDEAVRLPLRAELDRHLGAAERAAAVVASVRRELAG